MVRAVQNARVPIFFFQAENDYDLSPSLTLSAAMKDGERRAQLHALGQRRLVWRRVPLSHPTFQTMN